MALKRKRIVFFPPVTRETEIPIEDYQAFFIQNKGNTSARMDREFELLPDETFHAMMLKEGEAYYQKIHISFGKENLDAEDDEDPLATAKKKIVYGAIVAV